MPSDELIIAYKEKGNAALNRLIPCLSKGRRRILAQVGIDLFRSVFRVSR